MINQSILCDECKEWFQMDVEHVFSFPIFKYPSHWFLFGYHLKSGDKKWEVSLCSWLCTKNYVDRMYAQHHPEDKLCPDIVPQPVKRSDF